MHKFILILLIAVSCTEKKNVVPDQSTILMGLPQWHLGPKANTLKIEESKKLPQYPNQKYIFEIISEWIEKGQLDLLIAEGCEGEIDEKFTSTYNGWNYKNLNEFILKPEFVDILTLVPLKLEVKYKDKIKTLCGDNLDLINKHQLVLSELRGNIGYLSRLIEYQNNPKLYQTYLKSLEETYKEKIQEPLVFLKIKVKELEDLEKSLLIQRNTSFMNLIKKYKGKKIALVIGARHIAQLKEDLLTEGILLNRVELLDGTLPQEAF